MLTIIFCWLILFVAISLIGKLIVKNCEWYEYFWIGFVFVLGFLQIWSIFKPVNSVSLTIVLLIGFVSFIVNRKKIKFPKINFKFGLIITLLLLIISYYASQPVGWDDTLLYHLNAVKWGNLYAVVPGLANLHSRLGFNSSFFLFASMLNSWFMIDRTSHISLSFFTALLSVEYYWILIKSNDRRLKLFCLFTMPLIVYSVAYREIIASLSPDFAQTLLVLAAVIQFLKNEKKSVLIGAYILIALITIKFSSLVFALTLLIFVGVRYKDFLKQFILGSAFIVAPYLVRNVILSGWLLYPFPYFKFNVDWAVPDTFVKTVYIVTTTWAKSPGSSWVEMIGAPFWKWFPLWYQNNQNSFEIKLILFSLLTTFILFVIGQFNKISIKNNANFTYLWFASFASIAYIFLTAPDTRFAEIFIWTFFASSLIFTYQILNWSHNLKTLTLMGVIMFTIFTAWPVRVDNEPILKSVRWEQAWPTEKINGILYPTKQDFCGNSELPCTPEKNNIKWRVMGDISKGFNQ